MTRFLVAALALAGCRGELVVTCSSDNACVANGKTGLCTTSTASASKFCAFADSTCPSGGRWDATAGDGLGGLCVGASGGGDGGMGSDGGGFGDMAAPKTVTFTPSASGTGDDFYGIGGFGPNFVLAVGPAGIYRTTDGGKTWVNKSPAVGDGGSSPTFVGVAALSAKEAYVVGDLDFKGYIVHTTDGGETWASLPNAAQERLVAIASVGNGELFTVGRGGYILHAMGGAFVQLNCTKNGMGGCDPNDSSNFYTVWGSSPNDVYLGGDNGEILHTADDGATWKTQSSTVMNALFGAWASGPNDLYMVGEGGVVIHSTGNGAWSILRRGDDINMNYPQQLFAIWGAAPGDIYAVGVQGGMTPPGQILSSTDKGATWSPSMGNFPFVNSIWGSGPNDVWVAGPNGAILHGT